MKSSTLFDDHNDFLLLIYKISSPLCLSLNGLAVYLIIFKSSSEMKTYRWHLLHYQIVASAIDIFFNFLFQPIVFFPLAALTGHGFFITNLGISTSTCFCILGNLLCALALSIVELFFYRHQCIVRNKLTKKQFYFCVTINSMVIIFMSNAFFVLSRVDASQWSDILEKLNPRAIGLLKIPNVYYIPHTFQTMIIFIILITAVVLLDSLVPCFVCHIFYVLWKESKHLSTHTRKVQRKFFISLIWQVTVPFVFLFIPLVFVAIRIFDGRLGLQILNNIATMMVSSYGTFATLFLIYFNEPYRKFLFERLLIRRSKVQSLFLIVR